ncbi:uncharacterized protein GGS25DRAFT_141456 [Hypoxylon fragiforme]|uniref:uncharacterized protein n=1 Tax=Hypoxylon fragiforme TaxID=63214 RepID=UPI0020C6A169|nr:uncharacterized protein GGS25DRAFT_141456 [Hypoxylon fragiforme]KAI2612915.1 hypothetical protein GGS25DRAFT_141456 [Hypoxylon fragiforme]
MPIDNGVRCQALTLFGIGATRKRIQEVTGISLAGFSRLLQKATERGYVKGSPVLLSYVQDAKRSGRPSKVRARANDVADLITRNSTGKKWSAQQIADQLKEKSDKKEDTISRRTVLRCLKELSQTRAGFSK